MACTLDYVEPTHISTQIGLFIRCASTLHRRLHFLGREILDVRRERPFVAVGIGHRRRSGRPRTCPAAGIDTVAPASWARLIAASQFST